MVGPGYAGQTVVNGESKLLIFARRKRANNRGLSPVAAAPNDFVDH